MYEVLTLICIVLNEKYSGSIQCQQSAISTGAVTFITEHLLCHHIRNSEFFIWDHGMTIVDTCQRTESYINCYSDLAKFMLEKTDVQVGTFMVFFFFFSVLSKFWPKSSQISAKGKIPNIYTLKSIENAH